MVDFKLQNQNSQKLCDYFGSDRCIGFDLHNPTNHPNVIIKDCSKLNEKDAEIQYKSSTGNVTHDNTKSRNASRHASAASLRCYIKMWLPTKFPCTRRGDCV